MKCKTCKKREAKKRFCSKSCYWEYMKTVRNEDAPNWRGDNVGKSQVHKWLYSNYGQPDECEGKNCLGKSKFYDWCLKTGKEYKKRREYFLRLCRSCHRKYDLTPEKRQQAINNLLLYCPNYGTERKLDR